MKGSEGTGKWYEWIQEWTKPSKIQQKIGKSRSDTVSVTENTQSTVNSLYAADLAV